MRDFPASKRVAVAIVALMAVLVSGLLIPSASQAQAPAAAPTLETLMGQINRAYRMVKAQVPDKAQNAKTLEAVTIMENASVAAKGMTPTSIAKLPPGEQTAKRNEYRRQMVTLLSALLELEENLLADDNTKAAAMIPKIDEIQKQGHAVFRVD